MLSEEDRAAALFALDQDVLASSTQRTNAARLRTIESALALWGHSGLAAHSHSLESLSGYAQVGRVFFGCYLLFYLQGDDRAIGVLLGRPRHQVD